MDFTMGMKCPSCKKHNSFVGANLFDKITSTNYICDCGFSAALIVPEKGYNVRVEAFERKNK